MSLPSLPGARLQNKANFQNKRMVTKREKYGGGINQELVTNISTHITIYKVNNQQGPNVCSTENSTQCSILYGTEPEKKWV